MRTAIGVYQGATVGSTLATGAEVVLCHLCPSVAVAVRAAHPYAEIILRADSGDDPTQLDTSKSPEAEADRWLTLIERRLEQAPRRTYTSVCGPNEAWPSKTNLKGLKWRAAFEARLAYRVQLDLLLSYACLSVPVGNLEPEHLDVFAEVLSTASFLNFHGYLGPWRTRLNQEADPWYLWRPLEMWLPALKKLGLRLPPILLGECGTFTDWRGLGLSAQQAAQLCIDIGLTFEARCRSLGVGFVGACCFGFGTVGRMKEWDMTGAEATFAAAVQPAPMPIPAPVMTPAAPPLWVAILPSNQDQNHFADGMEPSDERRQMARLAAQVQTCAARYEALELRVFMGTPESADHSHLEGLWHQQRAAATWLATAPKGTLTVALNLHTNSGPASHLGYYFDQPGTVSEWLAGALAKGLVVKKLWPKGTTILSGSYADYVFCQAVRAVAAPVLIEIGSHENVADVTMLREVGWTVAGTIVWNLLKFFRLAMTRIKV